MSRKICPACGSSRIDMINYAKGKNDTSKTVCNLWIDFETPYSPHYVCLDCGQVFGARNIFLAEKTDYVKSFKFYFGSVSGISHYVMINSGSLKMDYTYTQSGLLFDFMGKRLRRTKRPPAQTWYKKGSWTEEKWKAFLNSLEKCNIDCWAKTYRHESLSDGVQWQVKIDILKNTAIESFGYNQFPPTWNKFLKVLQKYISKRIELLI